MPDRFISKKRQLRIETAEIGSSKESLIFYGSYDFVEIY